MTYLEKTGADLILPPFFHFLHHLKGDFLYDYVFSGSVFAGRRLFTYGRLVERVSRIDDRQAPAVAHPDGVDYVPMKTWRIFLIQLLNIAGLGPIYGALSGACWGRRFTSGLSLVRFWAAASTIFCHPSASYWH